MEMSTGKKRLTMHSMDRSTSSARVTSTDRSPSGMSMLFRSSSTSMPGCRFMAVKGWMPLTKQEKGCSAPAFTMLTMPKAVSMSSFSPVTAAMRPVYSPESK